MRQIASVAVPRPREAVRAWNHEFIHGTAGSGGDGSLERAGAIRRVDEVGASESGETCEAGAGSGGPSARRGKWGARSGFHREANGLDFPSTDCREADVSGAAISRAAADGSSFRRAFPKRVPRLVATRILLVREQEMRRPAGNHARRAADGTFPFDARHCEARQHRGTAPGECGSGDTGMCRAPEFASAPDCPIAGMGPNRPITVLCGTPPNNETQCTH